MKFFKKIKKRKKISILFLLAITLAIYFAIPRNGGNVIYGVTFSKPFAEHLGLDWKETYIALLDDAGVKRVRLPSYWTEIEPQKGVYKFEDLDWQIQEAQKRNVKVILTLGQKQPRWPECHIPSWAEEMNEHERQTELIKFIIKTVERYRDKENIINWQIENEPFLPFGKCPKFNKNFFDREVAQVRLLDSRPLIISDSGELSTWYGASKRADILGTTLYRIVWNNTVGYVHYPITSIAYRLKAAIIMLITGVDKIIIVELQAEPWGPKMIIETPLQEQYKSMSPEQFQKNIEFVKNVEFSEAYLWGGEWWYWLKTVKGDDRIWERAKNVFSESAKFEK